MIESSENWELLQELFFLAESIPANERETFLSQRCEDPELVSQVLALLRSSHQVESEGQSRSPSFSHARVGAYTLLRPLGSGGIGTVYLAERMVGGAPQRVALKMLAPHAAGPSFVERFQREQHILGSLDHPNITRLMDAGITDAGHSYLVMEYVDGEHLDTFCRSHRLGILARLQLFLQVCRAVSHAHRSLVVHLDLKPSNILVSAEGAVKLLDFGTSKLMQADSLFTTTVMATPAYASPEQLRHEPVTTGCDVYSLGAILFELLSGHRPYAHTSVAAMIEQVVREEEPQKLSSAVSGGGSDDLASTLGLTTERLRQALRGDLETITEKCLRLRPVDRYVSVEALMDDLERFIAGRPVLARPQTMFYRLNKFVRRNRGRMAVAMIAAMLLVAVLGYAEMKQRRALEEGRRAEQMETFMYSLFSIANSQYFGKPTMSVNDFLNLGIKTLPLYVHDRTNLRTIQNSLGKSLWLNDDYDDADRAFAQTMQTAGPDQDVNAEVESMAYAGDIAYRHGDLKSGSDLTARAVGLANSSKVRPSTRVLAKRIYAINHEVNGPVSDETLKMLRDAVQEAQKSQLGILDLADVTEGLALVLMKRERWDEAEARYREALQLYSKDPAYTCTAAEVEGQLGSIDHWRGAYDESLAHHQHALAVMSKCFGPESLEVAYQERYVGQDLVWLGRGREAVTVLQDALALTRKIDAGKGGPYMARILYMLANAYVMTGRWEDAAKLVEEEMRITQGKLNPKTRGYAIIDLVYAQALAGEGRQHDALPYAKQADQLLYPTRPTDTIPDKVQAGQAHSLYIQLSTAP